MIYLHLPHQDLEEMSHKKRQQVSLSSKVCKFFDFFVVVDKSTTIFMGGQSNGSSSSMDFESDVLRIYRSIKSSAKNLFVQKIHHLLHMVY